MRRKFPRLHDQGDHLRRAGLVYQWVPRLFSGAERQRLRVDLLELPIVHTDADADSYTDTDAVADVHATDAAAN